MSAKNYFTADAISYSDYHPFGMLMPNIHGQDDDYRYGFNGEEMDDEVFGTKGSSYDLGARTYDARIGRMRSLDPWSNKYPWQSPYVYHKNSPISTIDWKGYGDDPKLKSSTSNSTELVTASTDKDNRTILNYTKTTIKTDVFEDGSTKITTTTTSITDIVENSTTDDEGNVTEGAVIKGKGITTSIEVITDKEGVTTENKLSPTVGATSTLLDSWTSYAHEYNKTNGSNVPFQEDITSKIYSRTITALQASLIPFGAGGDPALTKLESTLIYVAGTKGASIAMSYSSVGGVVEGYLTSSTTVLSVSQSSNNGKTKIAKTPNSKNSSTTGPDSWQGLFSAEKWKELFPYIWD